MTSSRANLDWTFKKDLIDLSTDELIEICVKLRQQKLKLNTDNNNLKNLLSESKENEENAKEMERKSNIDKVELIGQIKHMKSEFKNTDAPSFISEKSWGFLRLNPEVRLS